MQTCGTVVMAGIKVQHVCRRVTEIFVKRESGIGNLSVGMEHREALVFLGEFPKPLAVGFGQFIRDTN